MLKIKLILAINLVIALCAFLALESYGMVPIPRNQITKKDIINPSTSGLPASLAQRDCAGDCRVEADNSLGAGIFSTYQGSEIVDASIIASVAGSPIIGAMEMNGRNLSSYQAPAMVTPVGMLNINFMNNKISPQMIFDRGFWGAIVSGQSTEYNDQTSTNFLY